MEIDLAQPRLRYAYNTNGLSHHGLDDVLEMLAENGYDGVSLTIDHARANPFAPGAQAELERIGARLRDLGLACVVETGAFFLLDPRAKHQPTLISPDPARRAVRVDLMRRAVRVAASLGAEAVTFFSGLDGSDAPGGSGEAAGERVGSEQALRWLVEGVGQVMPEAADLGVALALEPEPLHVVEDAVDFLALVQRLPGLGIALDAGHCQVTGPPWPAAAVEMAAPHLRAVSVAGMRTGVHRHLPLDEGDLDLPAVLGALGRVGYRRLVCAEPSADADRADVMIPATIAALRAAEDLARSAGPLLDRAAAPEPAR